jgi:epoxyqueuosine reductase QueG
VTRQERKKPKEAYVSAQGASQDLTQAVKELAIQAGAVLVGVAPIERFDPAPPYYDRAPRGHDPRDFVPGARSVVSIAMPILNAVMDAPAALLDEEVELVPPDVKQGYLELIYHVMGHRVQDYMLEQISQRVGQHLLLEGYESMVFPTTGIHPRPPNMGGGGEEGVSERRIWNGPGGQWAKLFSPFGHSPGPFSHRHAATRAGLGEFGYNNIVLTPQFGSRQRFNSIITEAELVPDPLLEEPICLRDECLLCLKACYMGVITMRDDPNVRDYRSVDVVHKDVIFIDTPTKSDPRLCSQRRHRQLDPPVRGDCARICPVPYERKRLPKRLQAIVKEWKEDKG